MKVINVVTPSVGFGLHYLHRLILHSTTRKRGSCLGKRKGYHAGIDRRTYPPPNSTHSVPTERTAPLRSKGPVSYSTLNAREPALSYVSEVIWFRSAILFTQSLDWILWDNAERCIILMLLQCVNRSFLIPPQARDEHSTYAITWAAAYYVKHRCHCPSFSKWYTLIIAYFCSEVKSLLLGPFRLLLLCLPAITCLLPLLTFYSLFLSRLRKRPLDQRGKFTSSGQK